MDWVTTKEIAELWNITTRQVQLLCSKGKIKGATKLGDMWVIPKGSQKPADGRANNGRRCTDGGIGVSSAINQPK